MKVVYVAGRFRALNPDGTLNMFEVQKNVMTAMEYSLKVWHLGGVGLCPHSNNMFFLGTAEEPVYLKGVTELLRRSDAILMVPGWRNSSGAQAELLEARKLMLPVFDFDVSDFDPLVQVSASQGMLQNLAEFLSSTKITKINETLYSIVLGEV